MANLSPGDEAVPFELPGVDDRRHALAEYADKEAIAVVFTCNHCPYARAWEDRLVDIQADYADRGVQLLAISANDAKNYPADSFPRMKERSEEKGFNFPYLYDESQEVARAYGAERTPEIFLFDKGGTLRYHGTVDDNYDDPTTAPLPTRQVVRISPSRATTKTTMKSIRSKPACPVGPQLPTTVLETLSLTGTVNSSDFSLLVAPEK